MEKVLTFILALAILLSLCACGKDNSRTTDPSQGATSSTEPLTDDTTDATRIPNEETASVPTEEPATTPTENSTTKPTETTATKPTTSTTTPTTCSHSYTDATCIAPKTCSMCGATSSNALGHNYNDATCAAPKTCSKCGATEGTVAGHDFYAGECKYCKLEDNTMVRIYSEDKSFSFILPRDWEPYGIVYRGGSNGLSYTENDNERCVEIVTPEFRYHMVALPVFAFHLKVKGAESPIYDSTRMMCEYVSSNGEFDMYLESVLETGIFDPYEDAYYNEEPTAEDMQELKEIIAMKDEIIASFRWE